MALGYDVEKISAGCLVATEVVAQLVVQAAVGSNVIAVTKLRDLLTTVTVIRPPDIHVGGLTFYLSPPATTSGGLTRSN